MGLAASRIVIDGVVQGVWFRQSTRQRALELGVAGWVRNLPDGRVEALFEGDEAAVANAVAWARSGPARAIVESLDEYAEQPSGASGFEILA